MTVGVADEQHNLSLLTSYFKQWLRRHKRAQEIAHFHEKLAYKERIARLRRMFVHWRHCIFSMLVFFQFYVSICIGLILEYSVNHHAQIIECVFR